MSKNICSCEQCCEQKVIDPITGLLVQGCILGRNELFAHRRLTRLKLRSGAAMVDDDVSIETNSGSNSQGHSPIPNSEQSSDSIPPLIDTAWLSPEGTLTSYYCQRCGPQPADSI